MWSKFYYNKKHSGLFTAILKSSLNFLSACLKYLIYALIFRSHKKTIFKMRILGIFSALIGKKSNFRIEN